MSNDNRPNCQNAKCQNAKCQNAKWKLSKMPNDNWPKCQTTIGQNAKWQLATMSKHQMTFAKISKCQMTISQNVKGKTSGACTIKTVRICNIWTSELANTFCSSLCVCTSLEDVSLLRNMSISCNLQIYKWIVFWPIVVAPFKTGGKQTSQTILGLHQGTLTEGKAQYGWPPCANKLHFIMKILFTWVSKQVALMRRSSVLSLPLQLVFPASTLKLLLLTRSWTLKNIL